MVLVGVGAEDILQLLDALPLQVGHHIAAVIHIAAIVEHVLAVAFHQNAQRLPHIEEVHLKTVALGLPGGLRRADGRGRDHGRGITGGQTQGQRRRKGKGQQGAAEAYFFFFEVFHAAFSFC